MTNPSNITIDIEYTDTFCGEANYAWVRRHSIVVHDTISDLALIRKVKRIMGLNGIRGRTIAYGDSLEFRPYRHNTVLFAFPR